MLAIKSYKKTGSIGQLPIFVCFLVIISGVAAVASTYLSCSAGKWADSYTSELVLNFFCQVCFYLALLLFGVKYYEVSLLMEQLLDIEDEQEDNASTE